MRSIWRCIRHGLAGDSTNNDDTQQHISHDVIHNSSRNNSRNQHNSCRSSSGLQTAGVEPQTRAVEPQLRIPLYSHKRDRLTTSDDDNGDDHGDDCHNNQSHRNNNRSGE